MQITPNRFEHLITLVGYRIEKRTTRIREPISASQRIFLTLRCLATGEFQQSLTLSYRIGKSTVCQIVLEKSLSTYNSLKDLYMKTPSSKEVWLHISARFDDTWNFPHCFGAIDGKRIRKECPEMTGICYYNNKGFYSIVLLAVCDSNYCFTLFNLRHYGSNSDSEVLAKSKIGETIEGRELDIPAPSTYMTCDFDPLPYFLVGDEIFPMKTWLMRPHPGKLTKKQRIFDHRLSRTRRNIENPFGILTLVHVLHFNKSKS